MDTRFPELAQLDTLAPAWLQAIRWDSQGLVQAIVQDHQSGEVLMSAFMDRGALFLTVLRKEMIFWSRSRSEYWHKGATSGNTMRVMDFNLDCDGDAILFQVSMNGLQAACHTGRKTCFHRALVQSTPGQSVWQAHGEPLFDPKQVYGP